MRTYEYGTGDSCFAIVGGTHGDEPRTAEVIEKVKNKIENLQQTDLNGRVKLVVANERALKQGVRYTEADLNRSFPGDEDSNLYEERLARKLYEQLKNTESVLSLHSTMSAPPPFAITSNIDSNKKGILSFPVDYVVDTSQLRETTMDTHIPQTITVEIGKIGTQEALEFGYQTSLSYLRTHNVLTDKEPIQSEKTIIEARRELEKSDGEPNVYYQNFQKIPKGEIIAEDDDIKHTADRAELTPILMSETGYEDLFGLIGVYNGQLRP